eukprot:TRINITY_DN111056_c0_g1_i1.p1 TRINITY_DN111056_c0_g1~~TRINITY_DN111056_c0_g1_i1.p1  ORF type:complete len:597 (-),score=131.88 TRINITY_DN111056_c0_g1_i1:1-1791(-)
MGNRSCAVKHVSGSIHEASVVPAQDPLLRSSGSVTRRIVRAEVSRDFDILTQVLGTGYSGAVRLAEHRVTKQKVAVKQFTKRRLKPHRLTLLQSEVEVYLRLDHPNVCRLLYAYEGKHDVWLVMEICACELYSRLCERKVYSERDAADVMRQMLQAVNYLHSHQIVHRDLKLENWMYGSTEANDSRQKGEKDRLKLIDFGFSRILCNAGETLDMPCGTLHYTSPEVLHRSYTSQCDMWSMGVICYMLMLGRPPFRGANNLKIAQAILAGDFPRDGKWQQLSDEGKDFLEKLLQTDARLRLDAGRALAHAWITGCRFPSSPREIGVDVLRSLRTFAQGSHLRRAALTVLAYSLTSRELQGLEQTFLDFDKSGRGTITLEQLRDVMQKRLEVSSSEVQRIFQRFDFAEDDEMHYTPFVAALLATRVALREDKVRAAFETFDHEGKGYITAKSLMHIFNNHLTEQQGSLSKEEAEQWIRQVDFKGNGVIDYDGFFAAIMGKNLWALPSLEEIAEQPTIRVFGDESPEGGRPRGFSESMVLQMDGSSAKVRHHLASAIIDEDCEEEDNRKAQSFTFTSHGPAERMKIRNIACDVDERYFM